MKALTTTVISVAIGSLGFVSAADCPSAVTAAALKAHAGATVQACKQEKEHGKTQYEVKLGSIDGKQVELDVSPEGNILLTEEYIAIGDVPPAVMTAFSGKYSGAKPTRAEKQTAADGKVTYEIAFVVGTKKKEATFAADGGFIEEE